MSNERVIDEIRATLEHDLRINHAAQVAGSEQSGAGDFAGTVRGLHQHRLAVEIAKSVQGVQRSHRRARRRRRDHEQDHGHHRRAWMGAPGLMAAAVMC
jgi:osmotically-inducible protein OsmY